MSPNIAGSLMSAVSIEGRLLRRPTFTVSLYRQGRRKRERCWIATSQEAMLGTYCESRQVMSAEILLTKSRVRSR